MAEFHEIPASHCLPRQQRALGKYLWLAGIPAGMFGYFAGTPASQAQSRPLKL